MTGPDDERALSDPAALRHELEALRAERDSLAAQVDQLSSHHGTSGSHHGTSGAIRGVAVGIVMALACISFTGAVVGVWAKRSLLNNEVWADRVEPLGQDPAVHAALAQWLTDELMQVVKPADLFAEVLPEKGQLLAVPLSAAVRNFVHDQVLDFMGTSTFANIWNTATTTAHREVVKVLNGDSRIISAEHDAIVINFVPLINSALEHLGSLSPELLGRRVTLPTLTVDDLPSEARDRLSRALGMPLTEDFGVIRIDDSGKLSDAQDAVLAAKRIVWLLIAATIVSAPLAIGLSHRRRRTITQMLVGLALGMVLIRRVGLMVNNDTLSMIGDSTDRAAVLAVARQFIDPLIDTATGLFWGFVAALTLVVITGPYRFARAARRRIATFGTTATQLARQAGSVAGDPATLSWLRSNMGPLQVGGALVVLLVLLMIDLTWTSLAVILIVLGIYEGALWWLAESARRQGRTPDVPVAPSGPTHSGD